MQNESLIRLNAAYTPSVLLLIAAFMIFPSQAEAQMTEDELWLRYEQRQAEHYEAGKVLLTWGTASLLGGSLLMLTDIDDFGLMTAGWGVVNTTIALASILNPVTYNREDHTISDLLRHEQRYNRLAAINTGLNAGYIAAGLGMARYGGVRRTREFGAAIFAQGAFLLVYDSVLLFLSSRYLDDISLYPAYFSGILPDQTRFSSGGVTFKVQF